MSTTSPSTQPGTAPETSTVLLLAQTPETGQTQVDPGAHEDAARDRAEDGGYT